MDILGCIYLNEHAKRMTFEEAYQFCYSLNVGLDTKYTGLIEIHTEEQLAILDQILGRIKRIDTCKLLNLF